MKISLFMMFLFSSMVSYADSHCGQVLSCAIYDSKNIVANGNVSIQEVEYPGDERDSRFGPYSLCEAKVNMRLNVNLGTLKDPNFPYGVKVEISESNYNYEFFYCDDKNFVQGQECLNKAASYKGGFIFVEALTPIRIWPYTQYVVDCQLK